MLASNVFLELIITLQPKWLTIKKGKIPLLTYWPNGMFFAGQFLIFRLKLFDAALTGDKLDLSELQRLSKSGIPEGNGRRAAFWRILLHYLPLKTTQWSEYLSKQRKTYQQFLGT